MPQNYKTHISAHTGKEFLNHFFPVSGLRIIRSGLILLPTTYTSKPLRVVAGGTKPRVVLFGLWPEMTRPVLEISDLRVISRKWLLCGWFWAAVIGIFFDRGASGFQSLGCFRID